MPEPEIGSRVIAVRNTADGVAYIYGYGTYLGRLPRPDFRQDFDDAIRAYALRAVIDMESYLTPVWCWGNIKERIAKGEITLAEGQQRYRDWLPRWSRDVAMPRDEAVERYLIGSVSNPCIELENGERIWGFECWWTSAEAERITEGRRVEIVDVPDRSSYELCDIYASIRSEE